MTQDDLTIKKDYAEIKQIGKEPQENCIRVYCSSYPNVFTFQIRTYKGIGNMGEGKPRAMMASVSLDIKEMENILSYMKKEASK